MKEVEIYTRRFSDPAALFGIAIVALCAVWGVYSMWIRDVDLRPATQLAAAATITSCMEQYAPIQGKEPSIEALWPAYYLCDKIHSQRLLYEEQVIRNENIVFQRYENTIIMFMVVSITVSGVILAGLQLLASYKLASSGKASFGESGELNISSNALAVKSSVVGVIILGISFAFFLVFVMYVYTFTTDSVNNERNPYATQESATQVPSPETNAGPIENVGKVVPAQPSPSISTPINP
jgi:hypothetical protein